MNAIIINILTRTCNRPNYKKSDNKYKYKYKYKSLSLH